MIALLLLVSVMLASQQPQTDTGKHYESAGNNKNLPAVAVPVYNSLPAPADKRDAPEHARQEREDRRAERDFKATVALIVLTFLLAVFTALLWVSTRNLATEAVAANRRQAGEVRESLNIGERTVTTMENNAQRQLRAYLSRGDFSGSIVQEFHKGGRIYELRWRVHNDGQTPAYDVAACAGISLCAAEAPPDDFDGLKAIQSTAQVIGPGQSVLMATQSEQFDRDAIGLLRDGKFRLVVAANVTYRDAFDDTHFLRFIASPPVVSEGLGREPREYRNDAD
jgi:hypothetical protein